jgi:glycosyltransferase involved in cell wall biosynthesis
LTPRQLRICFFGNVGSALCGRNVGGGELQMALLARSFAQSGHHVTIVDPWFDRDEERVNGIRVVPVLGWNRGVRVLRMFVRRVPQLFRTLLRQNADIYYVRMQSHWNLLPYLVARKLQAKFVIGCAHDLEAGFFWTRFHYYYLVNLALYRLFSDAIPTELVTPWLFRHADLVTAQHRGQLEAFMKKGIRSSVFPNLVDLDTISSLRCESKSGFVFVGSLDVNKGLRELYELTASSPDVHFKIVGQPRGSKSNGILSALQLMSNVDYLGRLDHHSAVREIAKSRALISTSRFEGFPNVFLEAWSVGVPVLSLWVDPDRILGTRRLGICFEGNIDRMIDVLRDIPKFEEQVLYDYVKNSHTMNLAAERFLRMVFAASGELK